MPISPVVDDAARAIVNGTPVDWSGLESTADPETHDLIQQLKVLSAIAGVHRDATAPESAPLLAASATRPVNGAGRWGHLDLLERVGSGSFGEVYRAWDTRLDREVALKLTPAGAAPGQPSSPILHEGRLLARVRHPNVATIYGAELIENRVGLWMEFVKGRTLEELLRSGHQFSLSDIISIGLELCRAVSAVHAAGVVHRDIKAQNVMRADDGRVVLMDFGTGRDQSHRDANVAGTPLYLAPEIFRGEPATARSDVYSVGVLLYHLLTGRYPVTGKSIEDLRLAHERQERTDLQSVRSDLDPALIAIVQRALAADPEQRYEGSDAVASDLQVLERRVHRRRSARLAVAAGVGGITLLGWIALGQPGGADGRAGVSRAGAGGVVSGLAAATKPFAGPIIAVKPFKNLSSGPESDLIVDGLTYELIRNLAIVDGLEVRSATSSFALKDKSPSLAEIGRQLGVTLVLEGSVSGSTGEWRVYAQLVQVAGDKPLWSRRFDRGATGMFAIQDEIALAVVNELRLKLGGGQRRYDLDPRTSELYLKARALAERRGNVDSSAAVELFKQVIAREPGYAPAWAGLADAYAFASQTLPDVGGMPPDEAMTLLRPAAEKALTLDPLLAEAHAAMGILHSREHRWEDAHAEFNRAISLNPSLSHVYADYSLTTLMPEGRFDEAGKLLEEALRRDPLSATLMRELGGQQMVAGRYEEAIRNYDKALALEPGLPFVDMARARALSLAGRLDEAMPYWESVKTRLGSQHWLAYAFVKAGRREEVEQMVAENKNPYRLAMMHTALGNIDLAFEALDRAAVEAPQRVVRLLVYPEMAPLRSDPRFAAIRARFNLH